MTTSNILRFPASTTRKLTSPRAYRVVAAPPAPVHGELHSTPVLGIVGQVREACRRGNRLATAIGSVLGGWVPLASYWVSHHEIPEASGVWLAVLVAFVIGGLTFSARKVYRWGHLALGYRSEALGFTLLTEGVMVISSTQWLRIAALGLLIAINAIATGVTIARGK